MVNGQDIICFSSIDWDFIWQGHQEIMSTLAKQGNRVLFVENTGVRAPALKDLPRLQQRVRNWRKGVKGFRQEQENLVVYSPVILPFPYGRVARWINTRLLLRAFQRWTRAAGFRRPIIWTFLPTPLVLDLIGKLDPELTVYYCIDDFISSSPQARRIVRSEQRLFRESDLVFVTSEQLRKRASQFSARVHLFPFGVRFQKFEDARLGADVPAELQNLPRPVVGYVGGIHQWVDQGLLKEVAQALPHASFVLVGPAQTDTADLQRQPNIHLLGARPHDELPRYIKGFDVGIVPYRLGAYTDHVYPTKLNEYLAMGIPVVATELPEIQRFNDEHGRVVAVARDVPQFSQRLQDAFKQNTSQFAASRIEVSKRNSWEARIARMSSLIEGALARRSHAGGRWQDTLGRLYLTARRRVFATVMVLALLYVAVLRGPVVWWLAEPLRVSAPPRQADAIVVFAGGVGETGRTGGGGYQERVKHAVDLYHAGFAPRLIFSSGYAFVFREAEVMRNLAIDQGVPATAIAIEPRAANTYEQVLFTKRMLEQEGRGSALLVSSPYHMRRAILAWRTLAPGIAVTPTPVPQSQFYVRFRGVSLQQMTAFFHEYLGIAYYWWKGWIRFR